jgi:hypothetical protein
MPTEPPPPSESEFPPEDEEGEHSDDEGQQRRRVERVLRDTIRRGLEKGLGTLRGTDHAIRDLVSDVKLPKEVVSYLFSQVDDTKSAVVRGVAREFRDFLEATDLAAEMQKALTSLSFEIKTEVRFIPNDAGGVKPDVKARVIPKRKKREPDEESGESEG